MRFATLAVTTMCIMLTVSPALAKDKKGQKPMDQQAMMELWKKLATPGEPHKLFASLAGSWTTQTKEWMEPGKPPTESTGTAEMKMLLDGRFLYQEYNAQMMGQPFSGIGIDAYDNMSKKYVTAWMDTSPAAATLSPACSRCGPATPTPGPRSTSPATVGWNLSRRRARRRWSVRSRRPAQDSVTCRSTQALSTSGET